MKIAEYIQWMRDEYGVELSEEELKAEGFTDDKKAASGLASEGGRVKN